MIQNDTICALATAMGGAIAVIRISGPQALPIVSTLCSANSPSPVSCDNIAARPVCRNGIATAAPNTIHYAHVYGDNGEVIDEVMISVFRTPRSYTGEDSVEISCHGSRYIVNKVLELLVQHGCRMANPGEYTMRAYLNGKLDLSQAEAVADLIASTNRATHQLAMSQLRGQFSSELATLRDQLLKLTSLLELELDFSDHEELEFADRTELLDLAQRIESHIAHLAHTFKTGQAIKQGIPVAIVGKTNVGKSTLLNALLKDDRAIVSDVHGTTRDTIEDTIDLNGITFRFIDTAGIRQTADKVEQIGINRTYGAIDRARIVLWLFDEAPTPSEISDITNRCADKSLLLVRNKADLLPSNTNAPSCPVNCATSAVPSFPSSAVTPTPLSISAKTGLGIPDLEAAIYAAADIPKFKENDIIVTSARHYNALTRASESIRQVINGMHLNLSADLLAEDLHLTLSILAEITGGEITTNETLNNIFSHFCVGK